MPLSLPLDELQGLPKKTLADIDKEAFSTWGSCNCADCKHYLEQYKQDLIKKYTAKGLYNPYDQAGNVQLDLKYRAAQIRTQKARGIQAVREHGFYVPEYSIYSLPLNEQTREMIAGRGYFVRPCPTRPRHGFVDSRIINTVAELEGLEQEALAADPDSEIVIMSPIKAHLSGVLTPRAITLGKGTDGATQGHETITLPLVHVDISQNLLKLAGVQSCPYFELLYSNNSCYTVQLRDGVDAAPTAGNWVPQDTLVTGVLIAGGDALKFETDCKNAPEGTVLLHDGGSLLSHYSQHAMLRNMPIIFDSKGLEVGQTLKATVGEQEPINTAQVALGLYAGLTRNIDDEQSDAAKVALFAIHNASAFVTDPNGAWLFGFSVGNLLRLATAAILGEFRHKARRKTQSRDEVYSKALTGFASLKASGLKRERAHKSFAFSKWKSGYGGQAWATCTERTVQLEKAIVDLLTNTGSLFAEQKVKDLIGAAHNVVNCAHNNGPFLSKFISGSEFDYAAHGYYDFVTRAAEKAYRFLTAQFEPCLPSELLKWAKLRIKHHAKKHTGETEVQFAMRGESVYHFQIKEAGARYKSFEIQRYILPSDVKAFLDNIRRQDFNSTSMAGSGKPYHLLNWADIPKLLKMRLFPERQAN